MRKHRAARLRSDGTMGRYLLRRLLWLIPVFLGVTFLTFSLMYISPNDPAEMMMIAQGMPIDPEVLESLRSRMGLDQPFIQILDGRKIFMFLPFRENKRDDFFGQTLENGHKGVHIKTGNPGLTDDTYSAPG